MNGSFVHTSYNYLKLQNNNNNDFNFFVWAKQPKIFSTSFSKRVLYIVYKMPTNITIFNYVLCVWFFKCKSIDYYMLTNYKNQFIFFIHKHKEAD